jgi:hypothetical protein
MAFAEDFSVFFSDATPGYAVATIDGEEVEGIFTNEYAIGLIGDAGFNASVPQFICRSADVAAIADEAEVVINAVTYRVANPQPDGSGVTTIELKL